MIPNPNEVYKHFKGNLYKIVGIAKDSETGEKMVVYQALYGENEMYVRSLEMFMSPVDRNKYPDVKQRQRFELIGMAPRTENIVQEHRPEQSTQPQMAQNMVAAAATQPQMAQNTVAAAATQPQMAQNTDSQTVVDTNSTQDIVTAFQPADTVAEQPQEEMAVLKPLVEEFLDADTIDAKRRILVALQDTIDQDDITIMATVMDIEIDQNLELPERYRQLMKCLDTKGRFETLRLR